MKPLLAYLEDHIFDKGLNVNRMKKACGVRDNSIALLFSNHVGRPPKGYITHLRMETAARMLRDTDLRVWQIAELVGYSGLAVFGKAFARWSGLRPATYRRRAQDLADDEEDPPAGEVDDRYLERALAGTLPSRQARGLIRRLLQIYGPPGTDPHS